MTWLLLLLTWGASAQTPPTKREFNAVLGVLLRELTPVAAGEGRTLEIQADYAAEWAQAFARRWETDQLVVYGGVARVPGATTDSLALMVCHEAGHLYGGIPYSDAHNRLSGEGQADFWGAAACWTRVAPHLPPRTAGREAFTLCAGDELCARGAEAGLVMGAFFAGNRGLPVPRFNTPDGSVAVRTVLTHPVPQCRLDTLLAGLRGLPRPACWFRD